MQLLFNRWACLLWTFILALPFCSSYAQAPGQGPVERRYTLSFAHATDAEQGLQAALGSGANLPLRVYGAGADGTFTYIDGSVTETYHLNVPIYNALSSWRGNPFQLTEVYRSESVPPARQPSDPPNVGIDLVIMSSPPPNTSSDMLGVTDSSVAPRVISIYMSNIRAIANGDYRGAISDGIIGSISLHEYTMMLLQQVITHELGHAFGLIHPDGPSRTFGVADLLPPLPSQNVVIDGRNVDAVYGHNPSIMVSRSSIYIRQLHSRYGRAVTLADIRPSGRDIQGVGLLWRVQPQAVAIPEPRPSLWQRIIGALCAIASDYPTEL